EDRGERYELGAVRQVPRLEDFLPVEEARCAHEAGLDAVSPSLPVGNLEFQNVLALAADAGRLVGGDAGGERVAPARLRDKERDRLQEVVVLEVPQDGVLVLQSLLASVPVVAELEVIRGEGGRQQLEHVERH